MAVAKARGYPGYTYMLDGGIFPSLLATLHSIKTEWKCPHSTWLLDRYSLSTKGPTKHCKACWKTVLVSDPRFLRFGWRLERPEEFQERARAAGG